MMVVKISFKFSGPLASNCFKWYLVLRYGAMYLSRRSAGLQLQLLGPAAERLGCAAAAAAGGLAEASAALVN